MVTSGPERWIRLAPAAKGLHQSPVDLVTRDVVSDPLIELGPIRVRYVPASCRTMKNTGHGVQITLDESGNAKGKVLRPLHCTSGDATQLNSTQSTQLIKLRRCTLDRSYLVISQPVFDMGLF